MLPDDCVSAALRLACKYLQLANCVSRKLNGFIASLRNFLCVCVFSGESLWLGVRDEDYYWPIGDCVVEAESKKQKAESSKN